LHDGGEAAERLGSLNLEAFALARLARFVGLTANPTVREIPDRYHLARRAAASAFADCVALGRRDEALAILRLAVGDQPDRA
jgi:hypothetical protein